MPAADEVSAWLARNGLQEVPLDRLLELAATVDELGYLEKADLSALELPVSVQTTLGA